MPPSSLSKKGFFQNRSLILIFPRAREDEGKKPFFVQGVESANGSNLNTLTFSTPQESVASFGENYDAIPLTLSRSLGSSDERRHRTRARSGF
jgi:hypothetical protein